MRDTAFASILVPLALTTLMLGLGVTLELRDFRRVVQRPRLVALGLSAQLLLLPTLGTGIAVLSGLPEPFALGLVILTLCPGGALSNTLCHLVRADVALSVTLTAIASLATPFTLPLLYGWAAGFWTGAEPGLSLPIGATMARLIGVSIVPIVLGMVLRRGLGASAQSSEAPVRIVSAALFLAVVSGIVVQNRDALLAGLGSVGITVLALNVTAVAIGVLLARLGHASRASTVAIGIEVGMQNAATATFVSMTLLGDATMALVAAVYALVMLPSAVLLGMVGRRGVHELQMEPS